MHKALGMENLRGLPENQPIMDGVRVHQINTARVATIGCGDVVRLGQWAVEKDTMPGVRRDWQAFSKITSMGVVSRAVLPLAGENCVRMKDEKDNIDMKGCG